MEIIFLQKGEQLKNEPNMVVCVEGEYAPEDLVLVGEIDNPIYAADFSLYQYPANYIKYGTNEINI
jgi:hypothetical protein